MATTGATPAKSRIFISYRREDAEYPVGRLAEDLCKYFPRDQVFQDIASIDPGADFVEALQQALDTCAAVLVIIGPGWLTAADRQGRRRLDSSDDWVRHEIAESLRRPSVRVFPVLLDAEMPSASDLPEEIRPLTRRQALPLTARHWAKDVAELIEFLKKVPGLADDRKPEEDKKKRRELEEHTAKEEAQRRAPEEQTKKSADEEAPRKAEAQARRRSQEEARRKDAVEGSRQGMPSPVEGPPGTVFRDGDDCPEMVVIPAGEFVMGSPKGEPHRGQYEGPQHDVKIARPFALGRYEVTVADFARFVAATDYETDAERNPRQGIEVADTLPVGNWPAAAGKSWRDPGFVQEERHPVVGVSWNDALAYTKWLTEKTGKEYRLPSEAEWEYAARAGTTTPYPWGDTPGWEMGNFIGSGSRWGGKQTAPVGSFEAYAFGLHDTIGNASEWVQDSWHGYYRGAPEDGSAWESGNCGLAVVRGGSWAYQHPRITHRVYAGSAFRRSDRGFRGARDL